MSRLLAATLSLLGLVAATMGMWYPGPAEGFTVDYHNEAWVSPPNGWSVCRQTAGDHPGRVHVVWTEYRPCGSDSISYVYHRYSDDLGRTWVPAVGSEPMQVSWTQTAYLDSARDGAICCLEDTVAVAFYDDYTEGETRDTSRGNPGHFPYLLSS